MRKVTLGLLLALGACTRQPAVPPSQPTSAAATGVAAAKGTLAPALEASTKVSEAPGETSSRALEKPTLVHFDTARGQRAGFLFKPSGAGPFSAIVFNHGSEKLPGAKPGQAQFYVPRGFVVFVPHRGGQGRSPGQYIVDAYESAESGKRDQTLVTMLEEQVQDVLDATNYLRKQPFVNPQSVAMAGCSLGGIETLLASERDSGLRAAIDFSGGAAMWAGNKPLRERMKAAARSAKVPVFFLQAENDYDTAPSLELGREMDSAAKPHLVKIFPPNGAGSEQGHEFCGGGPNPAWGPDVLAFLAKYGVEAKAPANPAE